ncbi:hypothetical protein ACSU1N_01865 [Thermogladius sp. 4427co]|uniref:hypothetical protein n=1 Tax=Thermogladius sp. 4427co TaxID=3450718 RepID=UPI003F796D17
MRPLVVAVYDPKWFIEVKSRLRKRSIEFNYYYSLEETPTYSVVYTDWFEIKNEAESRSDLTVVYDPDRTYKGLERAILKCLMKEDEYNILTIGVDTGFRHAYVAIGDSIIVDWGYEEDIVRRILEILDEVPARNRIVRIGVFNNGLDIAKKVKNLRPDARVEVVSESYTNLSYNRGVDNSYLYSFLKTLARSHYMRARDIAAALKIALRNGVEILS